MKTNIKAFKALILRYESITKKNIKEASKQDTHHIAEFLTGFGYTKSCTLCQKAKKLANINDSRIYCNYCIWKKYCDLIEYSTNTFPCISGDNRFTWYSIFEKPYNINNYRNRAKLMREVLKQLKYKQPKTI